MDSTSTINVNTSKGDKVLKICNKEGCDTKEFCLNSIYCLDHYPEPGETDCILCLDTTKKLDGCKHYIHRDCIIKGGMDHCPCCMKTINLTEKERERLPARVDDEMTNTEVMDVVRNLDIPPAVMNGTSGYTEILSFILMANGFIPEWNEDDEDDEDEEDGYDDVEGKRDEDENVDIWRSNINIRGDGDENVNLELISLGDIKERIELLSRRMNVIMNMIHRTNVQPPLPQDNTPSSVPPPAPPLPQDNTPSSVPPPAPPLPQDNTPSSVPPPAPPLPHRQFLINLYDETKIDRDILLHRYRERIFERNIQSVEEELERNIQEEKKGNQTQIQQIIDNKAADIMEILRERIVDNPGHLDVFITEAIDRHRLVVHMSHIGRAGLIERYISSNVIRMIEEEFGGFMEH